MRLLFAIHASDNGNLYGDVPIGKFMCALKCSRAIRSFSFCSLSPFYSQMLH
jgi:hypothetical protein